MTTCESAFDRHVDEGPAMALINFRGETLSRFHDLRCSSVTNSSSHADNFPIKEVKPNPDRPKVYAGKVTCTTDDTTDSESEKAE